MKLILFLILSLQICFATDGEYASIKLVPAPEGFHQNMVSLFSQEGFGHFKNQRDFASIGINQIFLLPDSEGYVTVKYQVETPLPLGQIQSVADGKLIHLKVGDQTSAFYFKDIPAPLMDALITKLQRPATSQYSLSPISSAHADDCDVFLSQSLSTSAMGTLAKVSGSFVASALMSCLQGSGDQMKSTYKSVVSIGQEAKAFWENPTGKVSEYYKAVDSSVRGLFNFMKYVGYAIVNPSVGIPALKKNLGEAGVLLGGMVSSLVQLPPEAALKMLCSLFTGIGIDVLLAATGAGAMKAILSLKKYATSLEMMGSLISLMKKLKMTRLEQLGFNPELMSKLFSGLVSGNVSKRKLDIFTDSIVDGSPLAKKFAQRGLQCSL
jgi:hypothetical protein